MSSQGQFANQAPDSGSIRVFYQTINNKDRVKAITISDVDKDGDNIAISLTELDSLSLLITASGVPTKLDINSIKEKAGYHFLDVDDVTVDTFSGSLNTPIAITPYLTETFFYNDYNATISNAEDSRRSYIRYDIDRTGAQVKPSNYNAIAGVQTLTISGMYYQDGDAIDQISTQVIGWGPSMPNASVGSITSSIVNIKDDEDFTFRVGPQEINAAIGFPQKPVISLDKEFLSSGGELVATSSLYLKFSSNSDFNTNSGVSASLLLAEQQYDSGKINASTFDTYQITDNGVVKTFYFSGASLRIPSGSYSGNVFMRLEQENIIKTASDLTQTITVSSILHNSVSDDFLNISVHRDPDEEAIPYAPKATVQDSNYTSTGLVNARYNGTKTTQVDYSGIEPAITAKPFEAAVYRLDEEDNFICSQSLSDRVLEEFLFIGTEESPGAKAELLGVIDGSNELGNGQDTIFHLAINNINLYQTIQPGDVLNIANNSHSELVQVVQASTTSTLGIMKITVTRDYNTLATNYTFGAGATVSRFSDTRIFKLEGNRLIALTEKKIWVKDNRTILKTSQSGYVTQLSTTCTV